MYLISFKLMFQNIREKKVKDKFIYINVYKPILSLFNVFNKYTSIFFSNTGLMIINSIITGKVFNPIIMRHYIRNLNKMFLEENPEKNDLEYQDIARVFSFVLSCLDIICEDYVNEIRPQRSLD